MIRPATMLLSFAALTSCAKEPAPGPPVVRLGRDECAECGMMIADERASAASLVDIDGYPEHLVWDDIGCLLDWEHDADPTQVLDRWVHDHGTTQWIPASRATFVVSESIHTPMASGIVAFAAATDAEAASRAHGGVVVSFEQLVALRAERMAARRRPGPAPRP